MSYTKTHEYWVGRNTFNQTASGAESVVLPLGDFREGDTLRLVEVDDNRVRTGRELTCLIEAVSHDVESPTPTSTVIFAGGS